VNIEEQMMPGAGGGDALAKATVDDLLRELKTRCNALVAAMLVDDDCGEEQTVVCHLGGRVTCIGLMRDAELKMTMQGVDECRGCADVDIENDEDEEE
jgi:hypothetical protein